MVSVHHWPWPRHAVEQATQCNSVWDSELLRSAVLGDFNEIGICCAKHSNVPAAITDQFALREWLWHWRLRWWLRRIYLTVLGLVARLEVAGVATAVLAFRVITAPRGI